jgi:carbon monoxide dehydrogenase subunit G
MEFVNEFTVPADIDTAWGILTDLERVAPCLPGATLESVDGDAYTGHVKVRVGPISVAYRGQARLLDVDPVARTARIDAAGNETKGGGTASADVRAALSEGPDGTLVRVTTDIALTGKPAQFGSGVMSEVGTKIIDTFASRLEELVRADATHAAGEAPAARSGATGQAGGDELDLLEFAGAATAKRLLPVAGLALLIAAVVWFLRRR